MFRLSSLLGVALAFTVVSTAAAQEVRITSPASGATLAGPDVAISIAVTGTTLVPAAEATRLEDLHVHYLLDTDPGPYLSGSTPVPTGNPNIVHSAALSYTFSGVAPGAHRVVVLLGYSTHAAFQPPVAPSVAFQVGAGGAPTQLPRTGEADSQPGAWLAVAGLLGVSLGTLIRARRSRRF
jgi:LPXTG-motif cell wall-anchored protein